MRCTKLDLPRPSCIHGGVVTRVACAATSKLRTRFPRQPLFFLGHSAGGAFALHVAARAKTAPAGIILVNPAYKLLYAEGMGPSLADYFVFASNYVFRSSALTVDMNRNPSAVKHELDRAEALAMQQDPLVDRYFSMRYLSAWGDVMGACATNIAKTPAPILLVQGAEDAMVDPKGNNELIAVAKTQDKVKLVVRRGGHGSSAIESAVSDVLQWLSSRAPVPSTLMSPGAVSAAAGGARRSEGPVP
jgi:alpha-beta hydrolase superfamily lysophospholipase